MRAAVTSGAGGPEVLSVGEVDDPRPGGGEVLLDVVATAVNRADTLQRMGHYPPPPGASVTATVPPCWRRSRARWSGSCGGPAR